LASAAVADVKDKAAFVQLIPELARANSASAYAISPSSSESGKRIPQWAIVNRQTPRMINVFSLFCSWIGDGPPRLSHGYARDVNALRHITTYPFVRQGDFVH